MQSFSGTDVDDFDINCDFAIRSGKLHVRNPANTFNYNITPAAIVADRIINLPLLTATDTFCMTDFAQTLKNKTIDSTNTVSATSSLPAVVVTEDAANDFGDFDNSFKDNRLRIWNPADTFRYTVIGGAITSNRNASLPILSSDDTFLFLTQTQTVQNKTVDETNLINIDYWRKRPELYTDCLREAAGGCAPFDVILVNAGTVDASAGPIGAEHPGVVRYISSTSANSGAAIRASTGVAILAGGEVFEAIMQFPGFTNNTVRIGLHDSQSSSAPTDGVYFEMSGSSTVSGKTTSNTTTSTTGTTYTASTATWYRLRITVTSTSRVDFYIFNDSGTQLWTDNLTTNIPNGAGRNVGCCSIGTNSTTTGNINVLDLDYMAFFPAEMGLLTR